MKVINDIKCTHCKTHFSVTVHRPYHIKTGKGCALIPLHSNYLLCPVCSAPLLTYNFFSNVKFKVTSSDNEHTSDAVLRQNAITNFRSKSTRQRFSTIDMV